MIRKQSLPLNENIRELWPIPKLWPGSTIFIIGGGPSVNKENLELIRNERVIGINQAFVDFPWVDILYFGDGGFYRDNLADIRKFAGIKVTSFGTVPKKGQGWPGIHRVGRSKQVGIESKNRTHIAWNFNSGLSAINLAYWLGAIRVILIGFDMHSDENGQHNYHDRYGKRSEDWNPYPEHLRGCAAVKRDADRLGMEIINTTEGSAISDFPIIPFEEVIGR